MTKSITPTNLEDIHSITVGKDDDETFVQIHITRNRNRPPTANTMFNPVAVRLPWTEAVLLRNALDELLNDK